jgi:WD40 repeat protein
MPDLQAAAAQKTRVFISYARAEMAFTDRLAAALEGHGFEVLIDRRSLPTLEDWRRELLVLIRKADTVVFIVSPRSIASPVCRWEVEQMATLNKRLAPVVLERVDDDKIPTDITRINYLFFDPPNDFETQVAALTRALTTDVAWWHEHTRLVDLAGRWDRDGRPEGQLLRRGAINTAQSWAGRRPDNAQIPEVLFEFLEASLRKEDDDREELHKREQRISERTQRTIAELAQRAHEAGRITSAMRLSLVGEPSDEERLRGIIPEPIRRAQLAAAAQAALNVACFADHGSAQFSSDGARLVTTSADETARIWDSGSGKELARFAHSGRLRHATFSADGTRVATASEDKTARVWNIATGTELCRLVHDQVVTSCCFNPDGSRVATASADRTARLWDIDSGTELMRWPHSAWVETIRFTAGGLRVVTTSKDGLRLWSVDSGIELWHRSLSVSPEGTRFIAIADDNVARLRDAGSGVELARLGNVRHAVFSSDGGRVLTISSDEKLSIWNAVSGAELVRLRDMKFATFDLSPDWARIALEAHDRIVRVCDTVTGAELVRFAHDQEVFGLDFSPDGTRIVTTSGGGRVRVWDAASGAELTSFTHDRTVYSASFSPDGTLVLSESRLWTATQGDFARLAHDGPVESAVFNPDATKIATASADNSARILHALTGVTLCRLTHNGPVKSVAFSRDGAHVITASEDKTARVWDAGTGVEVCKFAHAGIVNSAGFDPTGGRAVTASDDNVARVWDVLSGVELARLVHDGAVTSCTFSPSGDRILTASTDFDARLWDANGAELVRLPHLSESYDREVLTCAFSPIGDRVVTGSTDRTARLWDAASGAELARMAHDGFVTRVAFSPDSARIVTTTYEGKVYLWDTATGVRLARLPFKGSISGAEFAPGGASVVTACRDKTVRLWDVTWAAALKGDALVRAIARTRLIGEGRLTDEELRVLRPLLGESIDPDLVSRWLEPSPDTAEEAEIEAALAQWRRHREMALALAREDWAACAAEINTDLANRRAGRTKTEAGTPADPTI